LIEKRDKVLSENESTVEIDAEIARMSTILSQIDEKYDTQECFHNVRDAHQRLRMIQDLILSPVTRLTKQELECHCQHASKYVTGIKGIVEPSDIVYLLKPFVLKLGVDSEGLMVILSDSISHAGESMSSLDVTEQWKQNMFDSIVNSGSDTTTNIVALQNLADYQNDLIEILVNRREKNEVLQQQKLAVTQSEKVKAGGKKSGKKKKAKTDDDDAFLDAAIISVKSGKIEHSKQVILDRHRALLKFIKNNTNNTNNTNKKDLKCFIDKYDGDHNVFNGFVEDCAQEYVYAVQNLLDVVDEGDFCLLLENIADEAYSIDKALRLENNSIDSYFKLESNLHNAISARLEIFDRECSTLSDSTKNVAKEKLEFLQVLLMPKPDVNTIGVLRSESVSKIRKKIKKIIDDKGQSLQAEDIRQLMLDAGSQASLSEEDKKDLSKDLVVSVFNHRSKMTKDQLTPKFKQNMFEHRLIQKVIKHECPVLDRDADFTKLQFMLMGLFV